MKPALFLLFFSLAIMQPNATTRNASGVITLLQFAALAGTYLTTTKTKKQ